ncbi:hypothetical protein BH20ACT2_BH20ACT2_16740 [soil metagenome]
MPVAGQTEPEPPESAAAAPPAEIGGFTLSARANGLQVTYDSPGLLPVSPIVQLSVPESLATLSVGPTGYALSSILYPGPLIADIGAALAQTDTVPFPVPGYPIRAQAFSPQGPNEEVVDGLPGNRMGAFAAGDEARSETSYSGADVPPVLSTDAVRTVTISAIEEGKAVTRARTEVAGVSILAGLIRIESVVTDLTSISDGTTATTSGGTVATGVTVAGQQAILDDQGLRFADTDDDAGGPLAPLLEPLDDAIGSGDGLLGGLAGQLGPVTDPLNTALGQVLAQVPDLLSLLSAGGIELQLLQPVETIDAGLGVRNAPGLQLTLNYDGQTTPILSDLLALIPTEDLPNEGIPGLPSSPQAIVDLLKKVSIVSAAVAPANVTTNASAAFTAPDVDLPDGTGSQPGPGTSGGSGSGGFVPGTPGTPATPGTPGRPGTAPGAPGDQVVDSSAIAILGRALPALLLLLLAAGSHFLATGSRRLDDTVLAESGPGCPLDGAHRS